MNAPLHGATGKIGYGRQQLPPPNHTHTAKSRWVEMIGVVTGGGVADYQTNGILGIIETWGILSSKLGKNPQTNLIISRDAPLML
jgi:hypothetical protein